MASTLYRITEICQSKSIDRAFINELFQNGLIELSFIETEEYVEEEQLAHIEKYITWHYDLELNMQGIEVVNNLLGKITQMQEEIRLLKSK